MPVPVHGHYRPGHSRVATCAWPLPRPQRVVVAVAAALAVVAAAAFAVAVAAAVGVAVAAAFAVAAAVVAAAVSSGPRSHGPAHDGRLFRSGGKTLGLLTLTKNHAGLLPRAQRDGGGHKNNTVHAIFGNAPSSSAASLMEAATQGGHSQHSPPRLLLPSPRPQGRRRGGSGTHGQRTGA